MRTKYIMFLMALSLFSVTVFAGYEQPAPVTINLYEGGGNAGGDMISARNSDNDFAFIGCGIRAFEVGEGDMYYWGFCQASVEEAGTSTCTTENIDLLEGLNVVSDSSYLTFSWTEEVDELGNVSLTCTRIGSSTQSFYLQKGQKSKPEDSE